MRTFWLSFCDDDRPEGQQFLGACVVDVTQDDADEAAAFIALAFPLAVEGGEWIGAATRKAHRMRCNPGGHVATADVTDARAEMLALYPRDTLMSKAELEAIGPIMSMSDEAEP